MVWLQIMDALTTLFVLKHGAHHGASELNPLIDLIIQFHPAAFFGVKLLMGMLCVWLWRRNKLGAWIVTIPYTIIVCWNLFLCLWLLRFVLFI